MSKRRKANLPPYRIGSQLIFGFVFAYMSLQLLLPLRHFLYKRDLRWTHEGINFSWRMMADHHETDGSITIEDGQTGNIYLHDPQTLLTRKQLVMVNEPYLLVRYARFLKGYLKRQARMSDPMIRADIQVSVNGAAFRSMYDPNRDLSEASYSPFKDLEWVVP